jgi:hypothetical protein
MSVQLPSVQVDYYLLNIWSKGMSINTIRKLLVKRYLPIFTHENVDRNVQNSTLHILASISCLFQKLENQMKQH